MNAEKKVAFHTLGCKLNFSETSSISRLFDEQGYRKVDFKEPADIYVINTCSVTENADKECKLIVKSALRNNPDAFVAIIGCYAQLKPEEIASIPGVDLVLGASEKFSLIKYLGDLGKKQKADIYSCDIEDINFFTESYSLSDRTRTFLKIQDGCDYNCSFCTIPLARGKSRSNTIENVLKNAKEIASNSIKEIVLTGVNIGDFGKGNSGGKNREETFFDLLKELDNTDGIERFRISSIEPNLLSDEIIEFVAQSKRIAPHFHIPLQSGSDKILRLMRRRYVRNLYVEKVQKIKSLIPHASIGVDVIVGFPSETEEDFIETYDFISGLDISYLHVFTYSERENTEALNMDEIIPIAERKRRNKMLRILSAKKQQAFYMQNEGTERKIILESESSDGYMYGFTDNYIQVKTPFRSSLFNQITNAKLSGMDTKGTMEILLTNPEVHVREPVSKVSINHFA